MNERPRKRWLQLSLRSLMLLVLIAGILVPSGYHRVRTVQQRHRIVAQQSTKITSRQRQRTIKAKLKPLTWWQALFHPPPLQLGPKHHLKVARPAPATQDYQVIVLDPGDIQSRKFFVIDIQMGSGASGGSFDIFSATQKLDVTPREQERIRVPNRLAWIYDLRPDSQATMVYPVRPGETFQLGVTGNWLSRQGDANDVEVTVFLEDF